MSVEVSGAKAPAYKKNHPSIPAARKEGLSVLFTLQAEGFISARIDTFRQLENLLQCVITAGEKYKWGIIKAGNVETKALSAVGFRERLFTGKPLSYEKIVALQKKLLKYYEDNGYPFAEVYLDSISINQNTVTATLKSNKNKLTLIDSIIIKGKGKISPFFIYRYLQIKPGEIYNESSIRRISKRIKELQFLKEEKPFTIEFTPDKTKLILSLDKKRSSQFDGFAGFLPDNNTGKLLLTGDLKLKLQNVVYRGETAEMNWRKLEKNTQDLRLKFNYPYIFRTPFGMDYDLKLLKKDTLFLDAIQQIGVQYLFSGTTHFRVFTTLRNSSLISTQGLELLTVLPSYADVDVKSYGVGGRIEKLDYRFNPRQGFLIDASASAGTRRIKKNEDLNENLYAGVQLRSTQFTIRAEVAGYIPIKGRSVLKISGEGGYLSGSTLFTNELFRIGGLRTLRGFDEESIYASWFNIATFEYRYILEENSFIQIFWNGAYYEDHSKTPLITDLPYGFGAGLSFETRAGIFSLSYALGKQFDNPIQLRGGKIHFGVSTFF